MICRFFENFIMRRKRNVGGIVCWYFNEYEEIMAARFSREDVNTALIEISEKVCKYVLVDSSVT